MKHYPSHIDNPLRRSSSKPTLTLLGWKGGWSEAIQHCVNKPFEAATGIHIDYIPHIGLQLPSTLANIDLVWCNTLAAHEAARHNEVRPFSEKFQTVFRTLSQRAQGLSAGIIHAYSMPYVLTYHTQQVNVIKSWRELLDTHYKNKIAFYPGGNGFFPIAQVTAGGRLNDMPTAMSPCWYFMRKLVKQLGVIDYSIGMERLFEEKKVTLAFRALTNALAFKKSGLPVDWTIPKEGTCTTEDGFFMPKHISNEQAILAEMYLQFALSEEVQSRWCEQLGALPMHTQAKTPDFIAKHSLLPNRVDDDAPTLNIPLFKQLRYGRQWELQFSRLAKG